MKKHLLWYKFCFIASTQENEQIIWIFPSNVFFLNDRKEQFLVYNHISVNLYVWCLCVCVCFVLSRTQLTNHDNGSLEVNKLLSFGAWWDCKNCNRGWGVIFKHLADHKTQLKTWVCLAGSEIFQVCSTLTKKKQNKKQASIAECWDHQDDIHGSICGPHLPPLTKTLKNTHPSLRMGILLRFLCWATFLSAS